MVFSFISLIGLFIYAICVVNDPLLDTYILNGPRLLGLLALMFTFILITMFVDYRDKVKDEEHGKHKEAKRLESLKTQHSHLIGMETVLEKPLRPSGEISIDGVCYPAKSQGTYVEKDSLVKVLDVRDGILLVVAV